MAWTFTVTNPQGVTKTASVRNPEFNDVDRIDYRQGRGTTEGGVVYVQDLEREDQVIELSFGFLSTEERGSFEDFFGRDGTLRQARPFSIDITDSSFIQKLKVGMVIGGSVWKVGGSFKVGQWVKPDTAALREVYLDQAELAWDQERDERFSLDLRLRIHHPSAG